LRSINSEREKNDAGKGLVRQGVCALDAELPMTSKKRVGRDTEAIFLARKGMERRKGKNETEEGVATFPVKERVQC